MEECKRGKNDETLGGEEWEKCLEDERVSVRIEVRENEVDCVLIVIFSCFAQPKFHTPLLIHSHNNQYLDSWIQNSHSNNYFSTSTRVP